MQTPGIGIEVGLQKLFLTSFPASFVGYDLIEWLMERLSIEESGNFTGSDFSLLRNELTNVI